MPVHIEIQEARVFKAVCDENGFNRAAEKLYVTQSAVSQTIANLEKKLETQLLERNPLKLTETGIRLLNYAQVVLAEEDKALGDIRNIRHGILTTLSLALSSSVNQMFGESLLARYVADNALTQLKVNVMPSRQIISMVSADLWELGLGPFQQTMPPTLQTIPLYNDERLLLVHPDVQSKITEPSEVPLIVSHLDDPDMRPAIDKLRDNFGTIWEVTDLDLRVKMVLAGHGMTYLDRRVMQSIPGTDGLAIMTDQPYTRIPLTFGLYHRRNKQLSSGARRFIDVCREFEFS